MKTLTLKPLKQTEMTITIEGLSSLIAHRFDEKARKMMMDKKMQKKSVGNREACDPEQEFEQAKHKTLDGIDAIPAAALKKAICNAAHKDLGIEKTLVRKSVFIEAYDDSGNIPIEFDECVMREDKVKLSLSATDIRFRPEYKGWSCSFQIKFDEEAIPMEALINLINRAGFGVGILEWRPQKDGDHGRFTVVETLQNEEAA